MNSPLLQNRAAFRSQDIDRAYLGDLGFDIPLESKRDGPGPTNTRSRRQSKHGLFEWQRSGAFYRVLLSGVPDSPKSQKTPAIIASASRAPDKRICSFGACCEQAE